MFNKKRIIVIVSFLILSFLLITYGASRGRANVEVTFIDGYNDKIIDEQVIKQGNDAEVPESPKHENYVFVGWYEFDSIDTLIKSFKNIEEDLKVEARYEDDRNNNGIADKSDEYYNVRFIDGITGNVIKTESVLVGFGATAPTPLIHSNYTFIGWDKEYSKITYNLDVIANYSQVLPTMYDLRFHDKEGNVFETQKVARGNASGSVNVPIYEGYTFIGWYFGELGTNGSYNLGSIVTSDLDLYGYWTINEHTIKFDAEGGTTDGGDTPVEDEQIVDYGTKIVLPNAIKSYTLTYHENGEGALVVGNDSVTRNAILLGWCKNGTACKSNELLPVSTEVEVKEDVTYNAVWGTANSQIILTNALRTSTVSTEYEFLGWSLTSEGTKEYDKDESITLSNDLDLYAIWKENIRKYNVKFDGKISDSYNPDNLENNQIIDYNTEIKLPSSEKSYELTYDLNGGTLLNNGIVKNTLQVEFLGWCKDDVYCTNILKVPYTDKVEKNVVYTAIYDKNSEYINLATASKEPDNYNTYAFIGWDTDKDSTTPMYDLEYINNQKQITLSNNTKLYAIWKTTPIDYILELDANGGIISLDEMIETKYGYNEETDSFPNPSKSYNIVYHTNGGNLDNPNAKTKLKATFLGWCEGSTETCTEFSKKTIMTSNKKFTAVWGTSKEKVSITGASKDSTEEFKYKFDGWATEENGKKVYDKNEKIKLSKDIDLYAIWTPIKREYNIKLDSNTTLGTDGGIIDTKEGNPNDLNEGNNSIVYGSKIRLPKVNNYYILSYYSSPGYLLNNVSSVNYIEATFLGWCNKSSCESNELLPALSEVTVENKQTFTAVWGTALTETTIASADRTDTQENDYTFDGWGTSLSGEVDNSFTPGSLVRITKNTNLIAKYSSVKQKYNVNLNGNIDSNNNPSNLNNSNVIEYGKSFKLPKAIKEYSINYHLNDGEETIGNITSSIVPAKFIGWCKNNTTCTNPISEFKNQIVTEDVTYNSVFGKATKDIVIIGATKEETEEFKYRFDGWALSKEGTPVSTYNVGKSVRLSQNIDLYAIFTPIRKNYNLTFNPNGGKFENNTDISGSYSYGTRINNLPTPTKKYTLEYDANGGELDTNEYLNESSVEFLGWCKGTTSACTEYTASIMVEENETYTAVWGNSEAIDLISASKSSTNTQNFEFEAWYDQNNRYTDSITLVKNTTLVANYTASVRYYNVCFDSAYEKDKLPEKQSVVYESLVSPVSDLNSEEHEFSGWITDSGSTWNFLEDKVISDLVLYAKWQNSLEFVTNNGTIIGTTPNKIQEENATIILPSAEKSYELTYVENGGNDIENSIASVEFLGWCKDTASCISPINSGTSVKINSNTTYYAVWGEAESIKLPTLTKESDNYNDYTLAGWSISNDGNVNYTAGSDIKINNDATLYAVWNEDAIEYNLTLRPNGGTFNENEDISGGYGYNELIDSLPIPNKNYVLSYNTNDGTLTNENIDTISSATFLGWCEGTSSDCVSYVENINMTSDVILTAVWGISNEALTLTSAIKESTIDTNYSFKEWYYGEPETVKSAGDEIYLSDNLTVNARYDESNRNYTVIFENNGYGTKPDNQTVDYGTTVINPGVLLHTGYTFDKWYKDNTLITPWDFENETVNLNTINSDGNVYIYANMIKNNYKLHITITGSTATYNVNYNLGNDNKYTVPFENNVNITKINPVNGYYVSEIKLNNVSQNITLGTNSFDFKMPAQDTHVEIVLRKLTNDEMGKVSPIRSFYIEDRWVDVRLNTSYMNLNGTRTICIDKGLFWCNEYAKYPNYDTTNFVPEFYYSKTSVDSEAYLLNPTGTYNWTKYNNVSEYWGDDSSQLEISNLEIDGGWHYHLDDIYTNKNIKLSDYKYFYVIYVENGYRYIIEYQRTTGNNYTINNYFSIKMN